MHLMPQVLYTNGGSQAMARNQFINGVHHTAKAVARAATDIGRCCHSGHSAIGSRIGTTKLQAMKLTAGVSDDVSYRNTAGEF